MANCNSHNQAGYFSVAQLPYVITCPAQDTEAPLYDTLCGGEAVLSQLQVDMFRGKEHDP
jgi:hypothetical protein